MIDGKGQAKNMDMPPSSVGRDSSWLDTGMQFLSRVTSGHGFLLRDAKMDRIKKRWMTLNTGKFGTEAASSCVEIARLKRKALMRGARQMMSLCRSDMLCLLGCCMLGTRPPSPFATMAG